MESAVNTKSGFSGVKTGFIVVKQCLRLRVADPERFETDLDPTFRIDMDPDLDPKHLNKNSRIFFSLSGSLNLNLSLVPVPVL